MTRRVRLWITAIVVTASAALAAGLTTAAHASEEPSRGTGHSGQAAANKIFTHVHLDTWKQSIVDDPIGTTRD